MTRIASFFGISLILLCGGFVFARASAAAPAANVDFNHDIRPILSNNCFMCHGPDGHQRKAKLRLDMPEDAVAEHKTGTPIVPGDISRSEIIKRITSTDPDEVMPPVKSEKKLTPRQIELLTKWVASGGKYEKHWAFIPPRRSELPGVKNAAWPRNPIDRFVLARLEAEGLAPTPQADKVTLCRRLYLDLLGLPPTPKEVDAFVADASADAYEKLVDRLLANPHYGERMALDWLDAGRFADTNGYHIDTGRDQTRWRDWVIDAFNSNKPFDQFTIEQLAGDLLPNSTVDQKIATAFVRNNMINFEGGAIAQEYLTAYLMDRVNTTSTVFLGLTINCCQCHDHKFDPLKQKDYYSMYAFYNAVPERGLDGRNGNASPVLALPTQEQRRELDTLAASIKKIEDRVNGPMPEVDAEQAEWEQTAGASQKSAKWTTLTPTEMKSRGGATLSAKPDHSIIASGTNPSSDEYTIVATTELNDVTGIRLEALPDSALSARGPGRSENGNFVMTHIGLTAATGVDPSVTKPMKFRAASADFSQDKFPVSSVIEENTASGWGIHPQVGKAHDAVFELDQPIHQAAGTTLTITLSFNTNFGQHQIGHFRLAVTDARSMHAGKALPANIAKLLTIELDKRNDGQKAEIKTYFRTTVCSATGSESAELKKLKTEQQAIEKAVPTTMVMEEMAKPRDTFILMRGQYDKPGEQVTADVPESLGPLPPGAPHNRLGLAQWIVSPKQPLTSRVIVNRYWQSFFGIGIVKTVEDFGSQGEEPTHPELLDWLAVQFMQGTAGQHDPWDVKAMVKLMVTSATYRQSSATTPELLARDPENRLLAHGPRARLQAEFIRDDALAVSGLLNDEIGGKSVSPYQPAGLWDELMSRGDGDSFTAQKYKQDHGKDLYRRTMYTFWKRTCPPPTLSTFDAPDRETCTVRRARTNTPLQALVLMNDPTYVEASRKLAERMMTEAGDGDEAKIGFVFRLAMARAPQPAEVELLKKIYQRELSVYQKDADAAKKLLGVGESPRNEKLDQSELAGWTTVASVVLNLDETITKE